MARSKTSSTNSLPATIRTHALIRLTHTLRTARIDPNRFIEFCFTDPHGRPLRQAPIHRDLQNFLTRAPKALVELPRDHGKSTQVCARVLWELGRRPNLRVKIVCATEARAVERLDFLRSAVRDNRRLHLTFPDLRPSSPWEATAFTIKRSANLIGPSVSGFGIEAASTGTRADLLICDDIVDERVLHSVGLREKIKSAFRENLLNLLEPDGRFWNLATPWHQADLNEELRSNPAFALFRRAVGPNLEPVWPEHWPTERLAERLREIGSTAFNRGYRLTITGSGGELLRPEWIRCFSGEPACERTIVAVDPAFSTTSSADRSALVTLGQDEAGIIYCLDAVAERVTPTALAALLGDLVRRFDPEAILLEANGGGRVLLDVFASREAFASLLKPITATAPKQERIAAFSVPLERGEVRLRGTGADVVPSQRELVQEMLTFPFGPHDDLLDALALGTAYLRKRSPRIL